MHRNGMEDVDTARIQDSVTVCLQRLVIRSAVCPRHRFTIAGANDAQLLCTVVVLFTVVVLTLASGRFVP